MTDFLVKNKSVVFVKQEVTEGVYNAPSTTDDALEVLSSGAESQMKRSVIDRSVLSPTIEEVEKRPGLKEVTGSLPVEYKAGKIEGQAPRERVLYKSTLGGERVGAGAVTTLTGHTASKLNIGDADISKFKVGDSVLVKEAGKYEVRPVSEVDQTLGSASVTFRFPLDGGVPSDNVVVVPSTTYFHDEESPSFSVSYYEGGKIKKASLGVKCLTASLESWETAKIPSWKFAFAGLDLVESVEAPSITPDFSGDAKAPTMLEACVWINGVEVDYNKLGLNLNNEKTDLLSACSTGKIASRKTKFSVEGSINPYKSAVDVNRFNAYNNDQEIYLFGYAFYSTGVAGEFKNVVAFYIPQAKITELGAGEEGGVITDEIKFNAFKKLGKDTIFLSFI